MTVILPEENFIEGAIVFVNGVVEMDANGQRIEWLTNHYLQKVGRDESGWNILYQDPKDTRYWELSYPAGELQGGGAPRLVNVAFDAVKDKYMR